MLNWDLITQVIWRTIILFLKTKLVLPMQTKIMKNSEKMFLTKF